MQAIVRRSLLNILKLAFLASDDKERLTREFKLQEFVQHIRGNAAKERQVLLEQIADAILDAMDDNDNPR